MKNPEYPDFAKYEKFWALVGKRPFTDQQAWLDHINNTLDTTGEVTPEIATSLVSVPWFFSHLINFQKPMAQSVADCLGNDLGYPLPREDMGLHSYGDELRAISFFSRFGISPEQVLNKVDDPRWTEVMQPLTKRDKLPLSAFSQAIAIGASLLHAEQTIIDLSGRERYKKSSIPGYRGLHSDPIKKVDEPLSVAERIRSSAYIPESVADSSSSVDKLARFMENLDMDGKHKIYWDVFEYYRTFIREVQESSQLAGDLYTRIAIPIINDPYLGRFYPDFDYRKILVART